MAKRLVRRGATALLAVLAIFVGALALPEVALAREYAISDVSIDATVEPDGTLLVTETRTFDFDGSFNGVYWDIPTGYNSSNGKDVEVSVLSAGVGEPGSLTPLTQDFSGSNGTYEVERRGSSGLRVTLYSAQSDESVSFTISYEATGIVTRWEDTGELYWKFVSDGWDVPSENVTCTLHLPVPDGASLDPGQTVRAWGHGPLDAAVSFSSDTVDFSVPGVGTDEYAEMRVTFPAEWLSSLDVTAGEALPDILSEEQAAADEANARRAEARASIAAALAIGIGVPVASVAYALVRRAKYNRDFRPRFDDEYFRDVPTDDHPAVLGALYNGGSPESKELVATLMRLTDEGVVRLDRVKTKRRGFLRDKVEEDYRVSWVGELPDAGMGAHAVTARKVDEATLRYLFKGVSGEKDDDGTPDLFFSELEALAKEDPERYSDVFDDWKGEIEGAYLTRFSGKGLKGYGRSSIVLLAVANVFAVVACSFFLVRADAPVWLLLAVVALGIVAVGMGLGLAHGMRDVNRDAIETRAKLEALERWLREFTRLEEAVPTDVVLWNRLLVMAVVLGVAEEVIEQLKVALPEVLEDPYLMPTYGWYLWHGTAHRSAAAALGEGFDSAHHVSTAALAASADSSGGGGGGGFSGGGGGGFGGGGGGGAF